MSLLDDLRAKLAFSKIFYENGRKPTDLFQQENEDRKMFTEFEFKDLDEEYLYEGNNTIWHDEEGKCSRKCDQERGFNLVIKESNG